MTLAGYIVFLNALLFAVLTVLAIITFLADTSDIISPIALIPPLLLVVQFVAGAVFFDKYYTVEIKQNGNSIQSK